MTPQEFMADDVMAKLTQFQRNTVGHVMDRLYSPGGVDRFLVADQTGLGKTMVARGVIAKVIERLQHDKNVDRIDIVYVCSNADLAAQNLRKLNVTTSSAHSVASRLTLLAKHSKSFTPIRSDGPKSVNLVSFTPGTSFGDSWRSGTAEERAMLRLLLEREPSLGLGDKQVSARADVVLKGSVATPERFARHVEMLRSEMRDEVDERVLTAFLAAIRRPSDEGGTLLDQLAHCLRWDGNWERYNELPSDVWEQHQQVISRLRTTLARESVRLITPDLVILDEFQRFRQLLDSRTNAGELAHHLFEFRNGEDGDSQRAKVLLLSATPFKPFTYAEETLSGDNHHRDFLNVVDFLSDGAADQPGERIRTALAEYREALITGRVPEDLVSRVRNEMLGVMVRTERPSSEEVEMARQVEATIATPTPDDILGFVAMKKLARHLNAPMSIEYWKSAPYFANFMGGYKIERRVRESLNDPNVASLLAGTQHLDSEAVSRLAPIAMGNSRLQYVYDKTVGQGWADLLWLPPSLPYLHPGGPYKKVTEATKLLIFSSWSATPTAVAALLSHEADRRSMGKRFENTDPEFRDRDRKARTSRLQFRLNADGRADSMSTLALFWPMPGLAALGDPRAAAREAGTQVQSERHRAQVAAVLRGAQTDGRTGEIPATFWFEAFRRHDSFPLDMDENDIADCFSTARTEEGDAQDRQALPTGVRRHVETALEIRGSGQDRPAPPAVHATLAHVAVNAPGNIAWRSLGRLRGEGTQITDGGLWRAAAELSMGLRSLFARPETTRLIERLRMPGAPAVYWRRILQYCEWGNLQAVLDEYIHHLAVAEGGATTDEKLLDVARAAVEAITLRPSVYSLFDPEQPDEPLKMQARFALRFGGRDEAQESARQPQVRQSFNSPFWPFVLASTSVGQEGVDLHWWSHSLLHWNLPSNPVDFEQREGRVDRYEGHAIRKNIAQHHGDEMLASEINDPWVAGYELAARARPELGAFAPHWVYPGDAHIERHTAPFPLSIETELLERMKRNVALYRLTFGQPRQEDMLKLVEKRLVGTSKEELNSLRLDLSAPQVDE